CVGQKYFEFW
nr:immunoglobulin heavy chain junction region [Macaca mulatta]MOX39331.1 immunoglobulin heavy chain junction region [Macaca mulatta]MOX39863.1 immunoglobulin heavy chain junction region [Macaca mulatta]MOX39925.1 immunoglobulin heavy chain junction region [Macaca mulatta]MOX40860.1 immunoglobulin heavy chain junction region [Macaca mulatta]